MKITVIVKDQKKNWCTAELARSVARKQVQMDFVSFKDLAEAEAFSDWGDVVLSRNTQLDKIFERPFLKRNIRKSGALMVNEAILDNPLIILKSFQQKMVADYLALVGDADLEGIETFLPGSEDELLSFIASGRLTFPFIEKPDFGSQGRSVVKIDRAEEIAFKAGRVYQNFIPNDGDFRVLCLGGKVLGVIKRIARSDDFRNNVSQGGTVEAVVDQKTFEAVSRVALKAAAVFDVEFCGIDVIYDQTRGKYLFLEINTHPWWEGFQNKLGINVADTIVDHCVSLYGRKKFGSYQLVRKYYRDNFSFLADTRFHYASRMHLFLGDPNSKKNLRTLRDGYIGANDEETAAILSGVFGANSFSSNERELRLPLFRKYPLLEPYNKIFFKVLFADVVYHQDLRAIAANCIEKDHLLAMKQALESNEQDLAILSTHAINLIYNSEHYLFPDKSSRNYVDPERYFAISQTIFTGKLKNKHNLHIYFLTHCILGESRFYSRTISRHRSIYIQMIKAVEEIVGNNYFCVSLDNKLEFLVCARILGYKSSLESVIASEAQHSLATGANYLVDRYNRDEVFKNKNGFKSAEHRNVLYLMAFGPSPRFDAPPAP